MLSAGAKSLFADGKVSYGPFLKLADPAVVEVCGLAGFDHVVIDREHGPLSVETVQNLIRVAEPRGVVPFVRVPRNEPSEILRVLDVGAVGVHVPHVSTAEEARRASQASRFHPQGDRGVCRFVRAAGYTSIPSARHFTEANERTVLVLHIEGAEGLANLAEILAVPGVDVVFLGPYDLSQACGVPGEVQHPKVQGMMRAAVEQARAAGIVVGTFVETPQGAKTWTDLGVQYICYSVDVGIIYRACREIVSALKGRS
jgi:4-hydroxy-2-oxoheptanedioate aldolase